MFQGEEGGRDLDRDLAELEKQLRERAVRSMKKARGVSALE